MLATTVVEHAFICIWKRERERRDTQYTVQTDSYLACHHPGSLDTPGYPVVVVVLSPLGKYIFAAALALFVVWPISHRVSKKRWPTNQNYWLQLRQPRWSQKRGSTLTYANVPCLSVQLDRTATQQPGTLASRLSIYTWFHLAQWDTTLAPNPHKL